VGGARPSSNGAAGLGRGGTRVGTREPKARRTNRCGRRRPRFRPLRIHLSLSAPLLSVSSSAQERGEKTMSLTKFVVGARRLLYVGFLVVAAGAHGPARDVLAQAPAEAKQPSLSAAAVARIAPVIQAAAEANKSQQ